MDDWLESLLEQEAAYAGMVGGCDRRPDLWLLYAPQLPEFQESNRAIRLRADERSADAVISEAIAFYHNAGLRAIIDIDEAASAQGFEAAAAQHGMRLVTGDRVLMRYQSSGPPHSVTGDIEIQEIPNETGAGEAAEWIETAIADDIGWSDEALWRAVARYEAAYTRCRLFIGRIDGRPVGACDLFCYSGWGRIESVVTRPEARRRGVATALVAHAVAASLTMGCRVTYLFTEADSPAERLYRKVGFVRWKLNPLRRYHLPLKSGAGTL